MRFDLVAEDGGPTLAERILEHLETHGPGTTDEVRAAVGVRRSDVLRTLETLEQAGTAHRGPSGRRDAMGRAIRDQVWKPGSQAETRLNVTRPAGGTEQDERGSEHRGPSRRPTSLEVGGTDEPPDEPDGAANAPSELAPAAAPPKGSRAHAYVPAGAESVPADAAREAEAT
jgi:hypothetical protein